MSDWIEATPRTGRATGAPRRILYFNTWSTAHGGSSTSLLDIVSRLNRDRFEPMVLCPKPGELPDRLGELGVPVVIHPLNSLSREQIFRFSGQVPWYIRFLRRRGIALVHGNTGGSRRSVVLASWLSRIPYVQHVRNPVKNARSSFAYRVASKIITNSDQVAAPLRADPLFARKTVTIYNAVDLSRYDSQDDRRNEIRAGGRPVVGLVGQIVPRKGTTTAIRAMSEVLKSFPDALLVIVGCAPTGERDYEEECRSLSEALGLAGSVHFTGYRRDVPAWMRTFDVFVLPTRSEPFGKVVIEAMAASCPVVASEVGGIPEIICAPHLGTLIPPDDPHATAHAIMRYLSDRNLARRVGEASCRHVHERFTLDRMVAQLEGLYEAVLLNGKRRPSVHD